MTRLADIFRGSARLRKPLMAATVGAALSLSAAQAAAASGTGIARSFEGVSRYDTAALGTGYYPSPDTMGVVGATQFVEFVNGGFAIYDKASAARTVFETQNAFWAAAGQPETNGDARLAYDPTAGRWVATAFGPIVTDAKLNRSIPDIVIAVSATSDAAGPWTSTRFTGFAGGTADYPTLALDRAAAYIGVNDYSATNAFAGVTLNVIPLASLFSGAQPTTAGLQQFFAPPSVDRGFEIQGVNSRDITPTGRVAAVSLADYAILQYDIPGAGGGAATETAPVSFGAGYIPNGLARQPAGLFANQRIIAAGDDRISSSVWEVGGRVYSVHTVTEPGSHYTVLRYDVVDAQTNALLDEGDIGQVGYDYYQGSLAVNDQGQVVVGFNRSGLNPADGAIGLFAHSFDTDANGRLVSTSGDILLHTSDTNDYHLGSGDGGLAFGRQAWGDYAAVSLDPSDSHNFWVVGEFAREYDDAANGHPGGAGASRWGTWIAELSVDGVQLSGVPEPATWLLMIGGLGLSGTALRRRRRGVLDRSEAPEAELVAAKVDLL